MNAMSAGAASIAKESTDVTAALDKKIVKARRKSRDLGMPAARAACRRRARLLCCLSSSRARRRRLGDALS